MKVEILQFELYDARNDVMIKSRRWGTREGIARINGAPIEGTQVQTDAQNVGGEVHGLTARDFDPLRKPGDFQQQVNT